MTTQTQTTKTQKAYEIFVSDCNGWAEGCPSYEDVFFGGASADESYIHPIDGGHRGAGSLIVTGYSSARVRLAELRRSGDWVAPEEVNPDGEETRPSYAMREHREAR